MPMGCLPASSSLEAKPSWGPHVRRVWGESTAVSIRSRQDLAQQAPGCAPCLTARVWSVSGREAGPVWAQQGLNNTLSLHSAMFSSTQRGGRCIRALLSTGKGVQFIKCVGKSRSLRKTGLQRG